jgi:transcriptional regulator with GAF, ATPase, and Fis domain
MALALDSSRSADSPPADAALPEVLAELAAIASETLELRDVFDRIAVSVRRLIPFDNMGVVRVLDDETAVLHAATVPCTSDPESDSPAPLSSFSPRFRPRPGPNPRIDDALVELDPTFPLDAECLAEGMRSGLWEPFRLGESFGGVWLCANRPHAYNDRHQEVLRPIAALLGSAVEHWRLWDTEMRRGERLDRLESVLAMLAESLDVREIFDRLSAEMQALLPHDLMSLTELDVKAETLRVVAHVGECDVEVPEGPIPLTREEHELRVDFEILDDIPAQIAPTTARERLLLATGMRSWLRVPVRLAGEVRGSLSFFARRPSAYDRDDAVVALRLADRVALVYSHRRLAEGERQAAEARERAERLEATVETLTRELEARGRGRVVGVSRSWREVMLQVGRVASSETTVLVTGESGTGKEIVAGLVHQGSPRVRRPFVAVNCAALPEQLLESELFGHEKGAFTGAVAGKIGRLEQAAGGTLFLDEIGEMSPLVQAKLLRVLEAREFQRVGGTRPLKADVRVVAATNRDLAAAIARGQFREDLYYRLNVFEIRIPPLRERREDIPALAETFLEELGRSMGRPAAGVSRDAHEWLLAYPWPGNVRELRNAVERAILLCDGGLITRDHLPTAVGRPEEARAANGGNGALDPSAPLPPGGVDLDELERSLVERALRDSRGNKSKAARLLGLTRAQLYSRIDKYSLDP